MSAQRTTPLDWDAALSRAASQPRRPTRRLAPLVACVSCLRSYRRYVKKGDKFLCDRCRAKEQPVAAKRPLPVPYNEFPPGY